VAMPRTCPPGPPTGIGVASVSPWSICPLQLWLHRQTLPPHTKARLRPSAAATLRTRTPATVAAGIARLLIATDPARCQLSRLIPPLQ
jgi:hypothetical protein